MYSEENAREVVFAIFTFFTDVEDDVSSDARDFPNEMAIGSKKVPEFTGHGESDVLVTDIWERFDGGSNPSVSSGFAAGRTES